MDAIYRNHNRSKLHNLLITPEDMQFTASGYPIMVGVNPDDIDVEGMQLRRFNNAMSDRNLAGKTVHFFIEDYQFERLWAQPDRYIPMLKRAKMAISPDFSLFWDMPTPVQQFNHYRNQWLGAYWQANGITVIPNLSWSDENSYSFCFDGMPSDSVVMVSTVGAMRNVEARTMFYNGYARMLSILNPALVLVRTEKEVELAGNVIYLPANRKE